jgi:hypothetical protein
MYPSSALMGEDIDAPSSLTGEKISGEAPKCFTAFLLSVAFLKHHQCTHLFSVFGFCDTLSLHIAVKILDWKPT